MGSTAASHGSAGAGRSPSSFTTRHTGLVDSGRDITGQQLNRWDAQAVGDAFDGSQRQVAFAPFHSAHVGAVDTEHVGKGLLRQALGESERAELPPHCSLEIAFHMGTVALLLPIRLQTDR